MLSRTLQVAVAAGISLPLLCRTSALALQAWRHHLLPVQRLPAPDQPDRWHDVPRHQATAAHLVLALQLLTSTKTNMVALEPMRHLGINDKSAWRMTHKIMQVMAEREAMRKLTGFVQIDTYPGGERNGGKA